VINGVSTAVSGMRAQMDALDLVSNNLANLNTTGFKEDKAFFTHLNRSLDDLVNNELNSSINSGIIASGVSNVLNGSLTLTNRDLDVALTGDGYLTVKMPQGTRYTRNGSLIVNSLSVLSTADGFPVLGASGQPIKLGPGKLNINSIGEVFLNDTRVDRLKLVAFDSTVKLQKEGSSLLLPSDDKAKTKPATVTVQQGYLEQSNVNPVTAVVSMVGIMRQFEALQKSISLVMNDITSKSIDKLGR
jgi:flagellar basal-body rod protein FlgF